MTEEPAAQIYIDTFFARQPIFDARKKVYGYELLYRRSPLDHSAHFTDKDVATLSVISTALLSPGAREEGDRKIFIHFSPQSVLAGLPGTLPPRTTAVEVEPEVSPSDLYLRALADLKAQGYTLAVNDYHGDNCHKALIDLADVVFVDVLGRDPLECAGLAAGLVGRGCLLAAKRVEDLAAFDQSREQGFELFQGFFFEKPIIVPGRRLSTSKLTRLSILQTLESEKDDVEALTAIIESDVSISFRLLSFINSVSFGQRYKVDSIRHAILMLGWNQVKSWLWLIVLSDVAPAEKTSELPYLSSIRAKFMERTAANHHAGGVRPETLFLLGLFSLLEPMLDTPMAELLTALPLAEDVAAALAGERNAYRDWLDVARCFETADWTALDALTEKLGLDPITLASSYCEALTWANTLNLAGSPGQRPGA